MASYAKFKNTVLCSECSSTGMSVKRFWVHFDIIILPLKQHRFVDKTSFSNPVLITIAMAFNFTIMAVEKEALALHQYLFLTTFLNNAPPQIMIPEQSLHLDSLQVWHCQLTFFSLCYIHLFMALSNLCHSTCCSEDFLMSSHFLGKQFWPQNLPCIVY